MACLRRHHGSANGVSIIREHSQGRMRRRVVPPRAGRARESASRHNRRSWRLLSWPRSSRRRPVGVRVFVAPVCAASRARSPALGRSWRGARCNRSTSRFDCTALTNRRPVCGRGYRPDRVRFFGLQVGFLGTFRDCPNAGQTPRKPLSHPRFRHRERHQEGSPVRGSIPRGPFPFP